MSKQRLAIYLFWGGVFLLLFVGVALYFNLHKRSSLSRTVLLRVNSHEMTARDFSEELAQSLEEFDSLMSRDPNVVSFQKKRIIERFIHNALLQEWAKQNDVSVSKEEIEEEAQRIRSNYPDDPSFKEALLKSHKGVTRWKNSISDSLLQKKVFSVLMKDAVAPSQEDLVSYYNQHKDLFRHPAQIRLRQAVFSDEDAAQRVLHALGPKDRLEDVARKFSISPDAKDGGDTGWLDEGSLELLSVASKMRVGQRSRVIKSDFGYHIFEVMGKKPAGTLSFENVQDRIRNILRGNRENALYSGWLEQQVRGAKIFKNTEAIDAIQVVPSGE